MTTQQEQATALAEKIKKDNEKFAKLSPQRKRVQIACDVLRQTAQKRIKPTSGTWVRNLEFNKMLREPKEAIDRSFAPIKKCEACALGAMFVAVSCRREVADRNNVDEWVSFEEIQREMKGIFSAKQLKEIETAFEMGVGGCRGSSAAENYRAGMYSATDRMKAIMQNIVRNRGTFVPTDER